MSELILGLDVGTTSLAGALVRVNGGETTLVDLFPPRIFPEGVKREKEYVKSKMQQRRLARSARRTNQRRRDRKRKLGSILRSAGLLPADRKSLSELCKIDPYFLRKQGLDNRLEPYEFGRALLHLNQRRGFKSSRGDGSFKNDNGVVATSTDELEQQMDADKARTLGEYFFRKRECDASVRIRAHYTLRDMYLSEFDLLWNKQKEYHPEILTDDLREEIRDRTIFFQRPLKLPDNPMGRCSCDPEEYRCLRADWHAQQFRILSEVNNLRIHDLRSSGELTADQRSKLVADLSGQKEKTFGSIRKLLGIKHEFNLEAGGRKKLKGNTVEDAAIKAFGERWNSLSGDLQADIRHAIVHADEEELCRLARDEWDLDDEQFEHILEAELSDGYSMHSVKAIVRMLPHMENGLGEYEARERCGYREYEQTEVFDLLPSPDNDWLFITNPVVKAALREVRHFVNAVIRKYGKPDLIRVEMVRETKHSIKLRNKIVGKQNRNEKLRNDIRDRLRKEFGVSNPNSSQIMAMKLWEEQGGLCIYSGRAITSKHLQERICGSRNLDIDHILPYSRTLDNGYDNKILCFRDVNAQKDNRTPHEWLEGAEYQDMLQRVQACKDTGMSFRKMKRFCQREIELNECIRRHLSDTAYIAREVKKYLGCLYSSPGRHVKSTNGQITREIRYEWGLDAILDPDGCVKNRNDQRHHAVDALVVALTSKKLLRQLARTKDRDNRIALPDPWPNFNTDVAERVENLLVSYRPTHRTSGSLHKDSIFSRNNSCRKRLDELTWSMISNICDYGIKSIIESFLESKGIRHGDKIQASTWSSGVTMPSGVPIKKVRVKNLVSRIEPLSGDRTVMLQSNHHIEVITNDDGQYDGRVVSMMESSRRARAGESMRRRGSKGMSSIVQRDHGDGRFVMSLHKNDTVLMDTPEGKDQLFRVQKFGITSGSPDIVFCHYSASRPKSPSKLKPWEKFKGTRAWSKFTKFNVRKVAVDVLGDISFPGD